MPWVYILECADKSYYVGSTVFPVDQRVAQHNAGDGSAYTRRRGRRPVKVLWSMEFADVNDAYRFEKRIHGWSRAKRQALMEGRFQDLPGLSASRRVGP